MSTESERFSEIIAKAITDYCGNDFKAAVVVVLRNDNNVQASLTGDREVIANMMAGFLLKTGLAIEIANGPGKPN